MKHLARLAALSAAFALAAPFASATSMLTGTLLLQDSPAGGNFSSGIFTLSTVNNVAPEPQTGVGGAPVLNGAVTTGLDPFATNSPTPVLLWTGTLNGGNLSFFATSFGTPVVACVFDCAPDSQYPPQDFVNVIAYGYFTDANGVYLKTSGFDTVTFNPTDPSITGPDQGNLTENLTATTPEPSSLMLLGTGLMSASGMVFRRRKS